MSRILLGIALSVLCMSAQENRSRSLSATSGFGNILFPGTGGPPATNHGIKPIFPRQQGIRGVSPVVSARQRYMILPAYFPVPFYIFAPSYGDPTASEQPPPQAPTVIINQNFASQPVRPFMREYPSGSLPEPGQPEPERRMETRSIDDEKPTVYLIAMKDSSIYSSLAYWVEENTVHYITTQHSHNRATLELIDRELSIQLNRERGVEFKLP